MTDPASPAVFLSYAREDSDSACRIADALRSHGIEVWLDRNELRSADAWDPKIRRQIKQCALFLPVVSANTQERREGYFRLEWKLAAERTHLMAEGVPFIAPVVIDETAEANALVPAEFMRVQWTRLPGAKVTPEFAEQVKRLLAPVSAMETGRPRPVECGQVERGEGAASPTKPPVGRRVPAAAWIGALALAAVVVGAILAGRTPPPSAPAKSIAVLPFENQSEDKDANPFVADGVHEDIITNLTFVRDLRVVPRTSLLQYRGTTKTARQVGKELGAAYVLSGTVRRASGKVRVTTSLITAQSDEQVWVKSYDRDLTDIFALQSSLATDIATALQAAISPQIQKILDRKQTANPAAYDKLVQARAIRNAGYGTPDARERERQLFEEAVTLDSNFAAAWAWLANNNAYAYFLRRDPRNLTRAKEAIAAAVRIAPDDPDVLLNRGYFHYYENRDFAQAVRYFEQVARLQPNGAFWRLALGTVQRRQGRWSEALVNLRQATEIETLNADFSILLITVLGATRRFDELRIENERRAGLVVAPLINRYQAARTHFF